MIERIKLKPETSGNFKQYLATGAWNSLRDKLGLEFSQESQVNLTQLNKLLLTNPAVVYINHTSMLDAPLGILMLLSQLPNAVRILGPVGMKHYDWRRDPLSAGLFRLLPSLHIQPVPIVQANDEWKYKNRKGMLENLKKRTAEMIEKPGSVYGIAPEGTRNKTGTLLKAKKGIGRLAEYHDLFYLPAAIIYKKYSFQPEVMAGKPLQLKGIIPEGFGFSPDPDQRAQQIADLHMKRLAQLMPESLRGVYA